MGLGAGGLMTQRIYEDRQGFDTWLQELASRVFVHIANAELFTEITGKLPPPSPISAQDYSRHGLPWFNLYDSDRAAVGGSGPLTDVWSIAELDEAKIGPAAPIDPSIEFKDDQVVGLGRHSAGMDGDW